MKRKLKDETEKERLMKQCEVTKKQLMSYSDLFFQMIFDLQDEKKNDLIPRVIEE